MGKKGYRCIVYLLVIGMSVRVALQQVYDEQAEHFASTRKKNRPELNFIVDYIAKQSQKKNGPLKIIELGCGAGRLPVALKEKGIDCDYEGVDISSGLLGIAQQEYPKGFFVHQDMVSYLASLDQESVDMVVGIASVQHLLARERSQLWHLIQRVLRYDGTMIQVNRCLSSWFRRQYRRPLAFSLLRAIVSGGYYSARDVKIPRIDPKTKQRYSRYYHIFGTQELVQLTRQAGLVVDDIWYMSRDGDRHDTSKDARNSIIIAKKDIVED